MVSLSLSKLKGKDKLETAENYSILVIFVGAMILSLGIGINIISTRGISPIFSIFGALVSFIATISLIVVWIMREFEKEPTEKV